MVRQNGPRKTGPGPAPQARAEDEASLPVVVVGLGEVGRLVAECAILHPELELVGAADPAHAGKSLRSLVKGAADQPISADGASLYRKIRGGVALICTSSRLEEAAEEIEVAIRAGVHVVSSCEELSSAAFVDPELADLLDHNAKKNRVTILGTGINPGFVLDRLPAFLGGVVGEIRRVEGLRVVDLATRRKALQDKLGLGLTPEEFEARADEGEIGHVGLSESCALVADGLGLGVDEVEEELDPIVAEEAVEIAGRRIEAGRVKGVRHVAQAFDEGREVIRLTLEMSLGAQNPRDCVKMDGDPPLELLIPGGIPGDRATAWALVNAAPRVAASDPGLISVLDLPSGR